MLRAEGASPCAEQPGCGDVSWLMAMRSLPAAGRRGRGGARAYAWGTSIFTFIPVFFGNLQSRTHPANVLKAGGGGREVCNYPCKIPRKRKRNPLD